MEKRSIVRRKDIEERVIEITRNSPEKAIVETDLREKLREEDLINKSRKTVPYTYYMAVNQAISRGRLGESSTITRTKRGRRKAVRVFRYIESPEDTFNEIFADLDYDANKKEFGKKLEKLPPEAIPILLNKLEGALNNYSAVPAVIDFIISAIGGKSLATEKIIGPQAFAGSVETLIVCLSQAVEKAVEVGNRALLARINENVGWLKDVMDSGEVDKVTGANILLKLKNRGGLDVLLSLLGNACLNQYGTTPYVSLVFRFVELFPQEKERVKQELCKVLREDKGRKTIRKSAAESILRRI